MFVMRCAAIVTVCAFRIGMSRGDEPKKAEAKNAWAKMVVDLVTPEVSKKGVEFQGNAGVPADFELNFDVKKLGAEGKFSVKAIKAKYGPPSKIEKYATKEDGKVVSYEKLLYPPLAFTVPAGSDDVTLISAKKVVGRGRHPGECQGSIEREINSTVNEVSRRRFRVPVAILSAGRIFRLSLRANGGVPARNLAVLA